MGRNVGEWISSFDEEAIKMDPELRRVADIYSNIYLVFGRELEILLSRHRRD